MWLKGQPRIRHIPGEKPVRSFRGWILHCESCWNGAEHDVYPLLVSLFAAGSWPPGDLEAHDLSAYWTQTTTYSFGYSQSSASPLNYFKIPAPQGYNAAGFYGMKRLHELVERIQAHDTDPAHLVFGAIRQWGQVVEHDDGYRSEYARVDRLYVPKWLPPEEKSGLAKRYGVPTTTRTLTA